MAYPFGYSSEGKNRGTIGRRTDGHVCIKYKKGTKVRVTPSVARHAIDNGQATHVRAAKMTASKKK